MQYKQYNMKVNLWSVTPPNTSQYMQIHAKYMQNTCWYIPIQSRHRPRVYFWSWVYWVCICMYSLVFGLYSEKQYILIQSIQANTIMSVLKAYFNPKVCINRYCYVLIRICMYWYVKKEHWINTDTIQINTREYK